MGLTVGERLKKLREINNFNQTQVAEYLNFTQSQITKLEHNERKLKVSSLEKLCNLYQCTEEYILEGKGKYSKPEFAFRSNNKKLDLKTIAQMNKIINNIEFLNQIN